MTEIYHESWPASGTYISRGLPSFAHAVSHHAVHTFQASRIYIIVSRSLSQHPTNPLQRLQSALGSRVVGVTIGMKPHTLWSEVLAIVHAARSADADLLVTLGGGTLTDAAKIVSFALANDVVDFEGLDRLRTQDGSGKYDARSGLKASVVPIVCVPTSLSGVEYARTAGGTDDKGAAGGRKYSFGLPIKGASLVVLDPVLTELTPEFIWLSTGVRAIDHCVEILCARDEDKKTKEDSDRDAAEGLKMLVPGLLGCKRSASPSSGPTTLTSNDGNHDGNEARMRCVLALPLAMKGIVYHRVPTGASHAIGHQLGPMGVSHGETSCVILPWVCKYNADPSHRGNNAKQQEMVKDLLWDEPVVASVLREWGMRRETADLADTLLALFRELSLPTSLREVGIGEEQLAQLAEMTLKDHAALTNPVPLRRKEQVREILDMALG